MLENISINCHSSIKFNYKNVIYFDPFRIKEDSHDADLIFCTHTHYDHFSEEDILKIKKENTKIVTTIDGKEKAKNIGFKDDDIFVVKPNEKYNICKMEVKTINAYNENKNFHPKENEWVGYIMELNNIKYYIAGDTDITKEM